MTNAERDRIDAVNLRLDALRLELKADLAGVRSDVLEALGTHATEVRDTLADQDKRVEVLETERIKRAGASTTRAAIVSALKWTITAAISLAGVLAVLYH